MSDVWMGWIPFESGYPYGDSAGLSRNGDSGRAYGQYQFDYRYGLVPFLEKCRDSGLQGFEPYIALGAGNTTLIANQGLIDLFRDNAYNNRDQFLILQNEAAVTDYLDPLLTHFGIVSNDPYILGSLFSFAIRDGYQGSLTTAAVQSYLSTGDIYAAYMIFERHFNPPDDRWLRQYNKMMSDKNAGIEVYDLTGTELEDGTIFINLTAEEFF